MLLVLTLINNFNSETFSFGHSSLFLFLMILAAHWTFTSFMLKSFSDILDLYYRSFFWVENYQMALLTANYYLAGISYSTVFFNNFGRGILFAFTVVGSLYAISKKMIYFSAMTIFGSIIFAMTSIGALINMPTLMDSRLGIALMSLSIIYLAGLGCLILINRFGFNCILPLSLIFILFSIVGLGSNFAGEETSIFQNSSVKLYDTISDNSYRNWIKENIPVGARIFVAESWILSYSDKGRLYSNILLDSNDKIDISKLNASYLILNDHDFRGFIRIADVASLESSIRNSKLTTIEAQSRYVRKVKLNDSLNRCDQESSRIFSNHISDVFFTNE